MYADYRNFEKAFLDAIHTFWTTHDEEYLTQAATMVKEVPTDLSGDPRPRKVTFTGWLSPRWGYRVSATSLRRLNPEYRIRVRRYRRAEFGRISFLIHLGFIIEATAPASSPMFVFRITGPHRKLYLLPGSSHLTQSQLAMGTGESDDKANVGFVDEISEVPSIDYKNSATWLPYLANTKQREVWELIDSVQGQFLAERMTSFLVAQPYNARWLDRFAIAASGRNAVVTSDLRALDTVRPNPHESGDFRSVMLPEMITQGYRTRARPSSTPLPIPNATWLHYSDAKVQDGGTLIVGNELIVYEAAADPRWDFVAGQWDSVFGSASHPDRALVEMRPAASIVISEAILIAGRNDSNWFHWLVEYLPRVLQIPSELSTDIPILITSRTPQSGVDALRRLTSRPVIVVDAARLQQVSALHVVAPPAQVLDTTRVPWSESLSMNPIPLQAMRAAWGLENEKRSPQRRVFLRRNSLHRRLLNEAELITIAAESGFEIIDPAQLSFDEQLELFSNTRILTGASGAVMANYIMLSHGSHVVALASEATTGFVLPAAIASVAGASFEYVSGPPAVARSAGNKDTWTHEDFRVSPSIFEAAINEAISA